MPTRELSKAYDPSNVEPRWYKFWLDHDLFHADETGPKIPFSIVIPPPNVTGSLHMGHALGFSIQDILIRWKRMHAYNAMWLPGSDHAGIATQMMVERDVKKTEKKSRHDLGRDAFLERVWAWKAKHGDRIDEQMKAMGFSLDWVRKRFTMDEGLSVAVREAFVRLHTEGLIYRARRLINWCSSCQTALSDLEVENEETKGSIWSIKYGEGLVVATTRPETLLGDTAVAVHPDDPRYKHLIGKTVRVPLTERDVPVIADPILVDMEFGTGVVKVTPGHDFNDFATGLRHNLEQLSILDVAGKLIAPAPEKYRGLTVKDARAAVLADLTEAGLLVEEKPHSLALGHCSRCNTVVEPMLSLQWFVKADVLAKPAIDAVESGKTKFVPEMWTKTYMHWMTNITDWCISRQLWWGHRIPAWHCDACKEITVACETPAACGKCGAAKLRQDEDVLDTWFSSALWPFSTLGWPEQTRDLKTFYPTSVLVTGFDIIFFWVARMMMMGLHFMKKVPFRTVYITALVVDEQGRKMSKTTGNTIDPLDIVNGATKDQLVEHGGAAIAKGFPEGFPAMGADALRFMLASSAAQGRNIRISLDVLEGKRNFCNKLWNAARFTLAQLDGFDAERFADYLRETPKSEAGLSVADRWILSRLQRVAKQVDEALEAYKVNDAANALYDFVWKELCDWYIELVKPALHSETSDGINRRFLAQGVLAHTLETVLRLLHPFMPFITEEIWQQLPRVSPPTSIMITLFPSVDEELIDEEAERQVSLLMDVSIAIRQIKSDYNVNAKRDESGAPTVEVLVRAEGDRKTLVESLVPNIERATAVKVTVVEQLPVEKTAAKVVVGADVEVQMSLAGKIDVAKERTRFQKEIAKGDKEIEGYVRKLDNQGFVSKAPPEVVEELRERLASMQTTVERLRSALQALE
jgi:valyl-tRNA synthetase